MSSNHIHVLLDAQFSGLIIPFPIACEVAYDAGNAEITRFKKSSNLGTPKFHSLSKPMPLNLGNVPKIVLRTTIVRPGTRPGTTSYVIGLCSSPSFQWVRTTFASLHALMSAGLWEEGTH